MVDAMEVDKEDAVALQRVAGKCTTKGELSDKIQSEEPSLSGLLPRIADDDDASQRRMDEACAVLDALIGPLEDGAGLRQSLSRPPPPEWSPVQTATHALCSAALAAGCDMVAKCSDRARGPDGMADMREQAQLDQHSMNALLPLLGFALDSLRYPQLSRWHKRLAWHAATRLARTLSVVLRHPSQTVAAAPLPAPQTIGRFLLAEAQPVLLPPREARLQGDEGGARLALIGSSGGAITVWSGEAVEVSYDAVSHAVLPRTGGGAAAEGAAAEVRQLGDQVVDEQEALRQLDELARQGRQAQLPTKGEEVRFGREMAAVAQRIAAVQLQGSLLQQALENAQREAKRVEERAKRIEQRVAKVVSQGEGGKESALEHPFALAETPITLLHGAEAWLGAHPRLAQCDRVYARGQHLSVRMLSGWQDVRVLEAGGSSHRVTPAEGGEETLLTLHPWNHSPLQLPSADCEAGLARHMRLLQARNASMTDALSGERLDIFKQSVPIEVEGETLQVANAKGLAAQVLEEYDRRLDGDVSSRACFLLVADAATGKTVLMSQVKTKAPSFPASSLPPRSRCNQQHISKRALPVLPLLPLH